jgi:hypothetical protein
MVAKSQSDSRRFGGGRCARFDDSSVEIRGIPPFRKRRGRMGHPPCELIKNGKTRVRHPPAQDDNQRGEMAATGGSAVGF